MPIILADRLQRRTDDPSPLLISNRPDYVIGTITGGVLVALAPGSLIVPPGEPAIGDRIDFVVALVMALYMLWIGVELVRHHFRTPVDLPLCKAEQLIILKAPSAGTGRSSTCAR